MIAQRLVEARAKVRNVARFTFVCLG